MAPHLLEIAGLLFCAGVVGALLPLYRRWSERGLHVFVALAAGVFLGTIFLHLLPHMAGIGEHPGEAHAEHHVEAGLGPWVAALAGLLLLFAIEKVWLPTWTGGPSANAHTVLWSATYVGLTLHALTAGVSLSAVIDQSGATTQLIASLAIHKATETFSLATVMRLAGLTRGRMLAFLALFVALEPGAFLIGHTVVVDLPEIESLLTGFACGTFLYVAACDLLPEVFHGHDRPRLKLVAVLAGIAVTAVTMPFLSRALSASLDVFLDLAPYLLLGLFAAGLVNLLLARVRLARRLAGNDLKSVLWAALFGAPLPLCSCSVVPVAVSLRRGGASKGATSAFAISTPETGIDSLAVSFVLLDPLLAIARPIGAFVSAVASGAAVNAFVRSGLDEPARGSGSELPARCEHDGACDEHEVAHGDHDHAHEHPHDGGQDHDDGRHQGYHHVHHGHAHAPRAHSRPVALATPPTPRIAPAAAAVARAEDRRGWFARVLHYAYVTMLDDLALSLVFGVLLSGVIVAALPADVFESPIASGFPSLVVMLLVGIPLYVCALTSTPIAAALITKGLSPGAAFVFLLAGPATNAAALFMLSKVLGKRVVLVQLVALSLTVLALGFLVDRLYPILDRTPGASVGAEGHHTPGWLAIGSAVVLGALLLAALVRVWRARDFLEPRGAPA